MEKPKKAFYKKWWFWVIIAFVLYSVGTQGGKEETEKATKELEPKTEQVTKEATEPKAEPKKEEPKKEEPKKDGITKAEFEQVQTGMSYEDVVAIVGTEGEVSSESEIGGITTKMYTWKGESGIGANANMTFQNNELKSKAQFGLK